jgi:DNA repair exonuclease SbcCD nuclease subunit
MDYVALGHIHKASGLLRAGETWYSWPGCPEGRGFDETGEKFVNLITLTDDGDCRLEQRSIAMRRYETLAVDVTGDDPLLAIHTQLPDDSVRNIYRITLTGELDEAPDLSRLRQNLSELFFELQLRDETRPRRSLWERAGDDTLRGLFLKKLKKQYDDAPDDERRMIEQAARWGLAALDNREEAVRHDDP